MAAALRDMTPELSKQILHYASFHQRSVTLRHMVMFGEVNITPARLFRSSHFMREELPVRLAHRVVELDRLPRDLASMPEIRKVKNWYSTSFQELTRLPPYTLTLPHKVHVSGGGTGYGSAYGDVDLPEEALPPNVEELNKQLVDVLEIIKKRHDPVLPTMSMGITQWKEQHHKHIITQDIQEFLDRFYLSRIGIRFLIGQHIALVRNKGRMDNFVGIICTDTVVREVGACILDTFCPFSLLEHSLFGFFLFLYLYSATSD